MEFPKRLLRQGEFRRRKIRRGCFCLFHAYSITQIRRRINPGNLALRFQNEPAFLIVFRSQ